MTSANTAPGDLGIRVIGVEKAYGSVRALNGVDLEVPRGQVVGMVGRNGAGKTTLIRIMATSLLADSGTVWVDGYDVAKQPQWARQRLGLVLGEDRSFYWRLSGLENLEFFAALHGMSRADARAAARRALALVALSEAGDRRVDRYSTGMRSRLGIARALLNDPKVLLMDEPTRSLDPESAHGVREVVRRLVDEQGVSVFLATHDLHEAAVLSSSVLVMAAGQIVARGSGQFDAAEIETMLLAER